MNYINAHATSTLAGDLAEVNAIKQVFKASSEIKMNGTKVYFCLFFFLITDSVLSKLILFLYVIFLFYFVYIVYDRALPWGIRRIGGNCNH